MSLLLLAWLRQPTTVAGIAGLLGTGSAILSQHLGWQTALPLLISAATAIALPDNSGHRG